MIRKNGRLERATWDEAMDLIVSRSKQLEKELTRHSIGFYTSGQLFLEEYYALAMVGKAGLNTLHMSVPSLNLQRQEYLLTCPKGRQHSSLHSDGSCFNAGVIWFGWSTWFLRGH